MIMAELISVLSIFNPNSIKPAATIANNNHPKKKGKALNLLAVYL